jgi:hypothetical protein
MAILCAGSRLIWSYYKTLMERVGVMGRLRAAVTWQPAAPGVWHVTMASPPANALSVPLLDGLHAALDAAEAAASWGHPAQSAARAHSRGCLRIRVIKTPPRNPESPSALCPPAQAGPASPSSERCSRQAQIRAPRSAASQKPAKCAAQEVD